MAEVWKFRLLVLAALSLKSSPGPASTCFGTPSKGRIEGAVPLPSDGPNFKAYSYMGVVLRRNYVHEKVRDVVVDAYARLEKHVADQMFVYGETGWPKGGDFSPHKTHQNGLSVDFMVPVRTQQGKAVEFPASVTNKFGYGLEFDAKGRWEDLEIDFNAMALHLQALDEAAQKSGIRIRHVIFEPSYQGMLRAAPAWKKLSFPLYPHKVWIKHDEHYHVEFQIACKS
ncbi:penicillin-insensitive murein endopeptidase [Oligoflexus tunisiensis]|uniref:penicillin-insensitive murein endopeptidase n=1 Tax=Oligoflexus tunisiensis TaxID=708132 RepID=UPI000AD685D1|nr:penicillin-insensitive murein endopeptidase [Oligoflexus tunisiensis]